MIMCCGLGLLCAQNLKFLSLKLFSHNQPKGNNGDDDNDNNMIVIANVTGPFGALVFDVKPEVTLK